MHTDLVNKPTDTTLDADYDDKKDYVLHSAHGLSVTLYHLSDDERTYLINTFLANRRRWRREHQFVVRQEERRQAKIDRLRGLFTQDKVWYAEGGQINIKDMTPNHALNAWNLITKDWDRFAGNGIQWRDLDLVVGIWRTPLAQALEKRSKKRPTRSDKRKDAEARERFKDRRSKSQAIANNVWGSVWNEW